MVKIKPSKELVNSWYEWRDKKILQIIPHKELEIRLNSDIPYWRYNFVMALTDNIIDPEIAEELKQKTFNFFKETLKSEYDIDLEGAIAVYLFNKLISKKHYMKKEEVQQLASFVTANYETNIDLVDYTVQMYVNK